MVLILIYNEILDYLFGIFFTLRWFFWDLTLFIKNLDTLHFVIDNFSKFVFVLIHELD